MAGSVKETKLITIENASRKMSDTKRISYENQHRDHVFVNSNLPAPIRFVITKEMKSTLTNYASLDDGGLNICLGVLMAVK